LGVEMKSYPRVSELLRASGHSFEFTHQVLFDAKTDGPKMVGMKRVMFKKTALTLIRNLRAVDKMKQKLIRERSNG